MSYRSGVKNVALEIPASNCTILITGATGLIGTCIIDCLLEANRNGANYIIYGMSRSVEKIRKKFGEAVIPIIQDVVNPISADNEYDYIIHCASNADPKSYALYPVETILINILGNKNVLDYCKKNTKTRMIMTSTFEVYGKIEGESVCKENMTGIIDQTILRNGYSESKRTSELLVKSYVDEYDVNAVIARLPSVYGPTMLKSDSKAHAQFIRNALNHEDIVLKSKGEQLRTYCYVLDVVSGILKILFDGEKGEVYNVANEKSIVSIADVANECAKIANTNVIFDVPNKIEVKGFSGAEECVLDNTKLKELGWSAKYTIDKGLRETIDELSNSE